jgi:hypothetical protein
MVADSLCSVVSGKTKPPFAGLCGARCACPSRRATQQNGSAPRSPGLQSMWRDGYRYKKAGVVLLDLHPAAAVQQALVKNGDRRVSTALRLDVIDGASGGSRSFGAKNNDLLQDLPSETVTMAREFKAFVRAKKVKTPQQLLRMVFLYWGRLNKRTKTAIDWHGSEIGRFLKTGRY